MTKIFLRYVNEVANFDDSGSNVGPKIGIAPELGEWKKVTLSDDVQSGARCVFLLRHVYACCGDLKGAYR